MKKLILSVLVVASSSVLYAQTDVTFYTTKGDFVVQIHDDQAPITGGNFLDLVGQKFYDGVIFHRVINNFMIQGGDPTGTGSGGPGYTIQDEFAPGLLNTQKTISMANSGPNTGGSQFFINLVNNAHLNGKHAVFGTTTFGFDVVQTIGAVATNASDRPLVNVVMDSVRVGNVFTVGLEERNDGKMAVRTYPNPVDQQSAIQFNSDDENLVQVVIYDALGKVVSNVPYRTKNGLNSIYVFELIGDSPKKGMYIAKVIGEGAFGTSSFIVK